MEKENVGRVVAEISSMFSNNFLGRFRFERFREWCEGGNVFFNDNDLCEEDESDCMDIMDRIAPHVDALTDAIYELLSEASASDNTKYKNYDRYII